VTLSAGTRLGAFEILSLLGEGGMGEVYRAKDTQLGRDVALKIVRPALAEEPGFLARFEREARIASGINHPNVAHIYAGGQYDGRPYYVMELVEGQSLAEKMMAERIPGPRAMEYLRQAAEGLAAASERGITHRDIKPANLMVDAKGQLKIVDFGLARNTAPGDTITSGVVLGSPHYMAPEQAVGGETDRRSDIYSLGASFYHLLTGLPPFEAPTPVAVLMKHVHEPLVAVRERRPEIPAGVAAVIEKMMRKLPEDRFQSYEELLAALENLRRGIAFFDRAPTIATRAVAAERTRWIPMPIILVFALAATGGVVFVLRQKSPRAPAPEVASRQSTGTAPLFSSGGSSGSAAPDAANGAASDASSPATKSIAVGGVTVGIPSNSPFDPAPYITAALQTKTLANMKKIESALRVCFAERNALPQTLEELARSFGLDRDDLKDGWGNPIDFQPVGDLAFRIHSMGADGKSATADDLTIERKVLPGLD
jgi:serine/threonine protein kinase